MSEEVIAPIEVGRTWMQAGEVVAEARPSRPGDVSGDPWTWWVHSRLAGGMCHGGARSLDEAVAYAQRYLPDEPEPTRTLFSCRTCCAQSCGGWSDGAMDRPGWHDIERIDGPRSMCPGCWVIGDAMLDGLREEYPHASIGRERPHRPTSATEAPTAPSEPDEGAVSPVGPGGAVRPRVGAWAGARTGGVADVWEGRRAYPDGATAASVTGTYWEVRDPAGARMDDGFALAGQGDGRIRADAALEAAGYVLEGGAHVDPEAPVSASDVIRAKLGEVERLSAEVARLTDYVKGVEKQWDVARGEVDQLKVELKREVGRSLRDADEAREAARRLRCEPGDVAGAAQAALEQAALARGEAAGLERALRVLAEVRRG